MFAATPPLRHFGSSCQTATRRRGRVDGRRRGAREALLVDVRKAHLRAYVDEDVFVALPPEVSQPGMCAELRRSLYGT
eukprot:7467385-Alexandrium_andersonii.AAC.1